jgi:hypothetical protein
MGSIQILLKSLVYGKYLSATFRKRELLSTNLRTAESDSIVLAGLSPVQS